MGVIRAVVQADGVAGLWKGAMPGLVRSAILTAAQCATYDEVRAEGAGEGVGAGRGGWRKRGGGRPRSAPRTTRRAGRGRRL